MSRGTKQLARKLWSTDDELFTLVNKELCTCVVGDVMDKMALQHFNSCLRKYVRYVRTWL